MKKFSVLLLLLLYTGYSFACSTFLLSKDGRHVFGRNYDWVTGNGMVMVNQRDMAKTSFAPAGGKTISWVSRYGSITFNQFGKEFPNGGMNEKGLVVELMWLNETIYPAADDRAALNELQWIQYQLDNCATVTEVIVSDKNIRISRSGAVPLHYLVADAAGNTATIEFINGKTVVHKGKSLDHPVLTNTVYKDAVQQYNTIKDNKRISTEDNSIYRFATACRMVQQFRSAGDKEDAVDYAFNILDKISQGSFTKWSIVYDITNRQVYCITNDQRQRKQFSFSDVDFSCSDTPLAFNLNGKAGGVVSKNFSPLGFEQNKKLIEQSARESRSRIEIPAASIAQAAGYFRQVQCKRKEELSGEN